MGKEEVFCRSSHKSTLNIITSHTNAKIGLLIHIIVPNHWPTPYFCEWGPIYPSAGNSLVFKTSLMALWWWRSSDIAILILWIMKQPWRPLKFVLNPHHHAISTVTVRPHLQSRQKASSCFLASPTCGEWEGLFADLEHYRFHRLCGCSLINWKENAKVFLKWYLLQKPRQGLIKLGHVAKGKSGRWINKAVFGEFVNEI